MAAALTAQQRQVILNSAQVFQDGVNAMNQVYSQVFSAGDPHSPSSHQEAKDPALSLRA
jgi:hypothetical protein